MTATFTALSNFIESIHWRPKICEILMIGMLRANTCNIFALSKNTCPKYHLINGFATIIIIDEVDMLTAK